MKARLGGEIHIIKINECHDVEVLYCNFGQSMPRAAVRLRTQLFLERIKSVVNNNNSTITTKPHFHARVTSSCVSAIDNKTVTLVMHVLMTIRVHVCMCTKCF